jgi:hypothetical protein
MLEVEMSGKGGLAMLGCTVFFHGGFGRDYLSLFGREIAF